MSKTAHTPGPWKVVEDPFISVVTEWTVMDDDEPSSETYHTIVHDCDYDGWVDLSVPRANARLISAAPDMLEALRSILPEIDAEIEQRQSSGNDEYWQGLQALSDAGHAAIAKAEGRP